MKEKEILDLLEKMLVQATQRVLAEAGQTVTAEEARNLVSKIGTRIMFSQSMPQERVDKIILSKASPIT